MSVMLCSCKNNAWEMMPKAMAFPGIPASEKGQEWRKKGLGTHITQSFLHQMLSLYWEDFNARNPVLGSVE
jgi:hypothetical protein